jgi:hypothetical protein
MPVFNTLPLSRATPNGDRRYYAPRWLARRQVAGRLSEGLKLLCGMFYIRLPPSRESCLDVEEYRESCLGVEGCGEEDTATSACSLRSWRRWRCSRWSYGWDCTGRGFESGAPSVGLVQHVGWLDPVCTHGDGLAANEELQCSLSARAPDTGHCRVASEPGVLCPDGEKHVQLWRSLCTNVAA